MKYKEEIMAGLAIGIFVTFIFSVLIFESKMEAMTYTELTGKSVTTYQAMWVDLRVVEPAKID